MNRTKYRTSLLRQALLGLGAVLVLIEPSLAETWNNIEPLKSRRADVVQTLGSPINEKAREADILQFKVIGGTVTVVFLDEKFVTTRKLSRDLIGTVRQIVLKHEGASDTPESLGLPGKKNFKPETSGGITIYRNLKDGIIYTFIDGRLRTTYYTASTAQWGRAQSGKYSIK